jgi:hypothetical protein
MSALAGKRVLFIGIGFYDYETSIVEKLNEQGAVVRAFLPAVPRAGIWGLTLRLLGRKGRPLIELVERGALECADTLAFDYVLVIKSVDLRSEFIAELRRKQPRAAFILYQWDSVARLQGIEERLPYFDRVLTFDRLDSAALPRFEFRPLFYRDDRNAADELDRESRIDLCFVGWLHSDRLELIRRIQSIARRNHLSFFVYLYTGLRAAVKLMLDGNGRDVHVRTMPYSELLRLYRRASVIVDLPHTMQSGLTIRAIEAVGHGKKLLTTATDVLNYDFYSDENVRLLSADNPELDAAFIRAEPLPYPPSVRRNYSLDAWIEDVFGLTAPPARKFGSA